MISPSPLCWRYHSLPLRQRYAIINEQYVVTFFIILTNNVIRIMTSVLRLPKVATSFHVIMTLLLSHVSAGNMYLGHDSNSEKFHRFSLDNF